MRAGGGVRGEMWARRAGASGVGSPDAGLRGSPVWALGAVDRGRHAHRPRPLRPAARRCRAHPPLRLHAFRAHPLIPSWTRTARLRPRLPGCGGCSYGEVFKVRRHSDGMEMVLKEVSMVGISEQEEREILNETSCMMQLSHPHIISYVGSFLERGSLHIVMEFASGGDLQCLIRRHAQAGTFVCEDRLWKFLIQLTQGLQHAHSRRILHRDIKASNVFIDANDNIKIGDLGLGKVLGAGAKSRPTLRPYDGACAHATLASRTALLCTVRCPVVADACPLRRRLAVRLVAGGHTDLHEPRNV